MIREMTMDEAFEVVGGDPAQLDPGRSGGGGGGFGGGGGNFQDGAIAIAIGAAGSAVWDGVKAVVGSIASIGSNNPSFTPAPRPSPPPIAPSPSPRGGGSGGGPDRYI